VFIATGRDKQTHRNILSAYRKVNSQRSKGTKMIWNLANVCIDPACNCNAECPCGTEDLTPAKTGDSIKKKDSYLLSDKSPAPGQVIGAAGTLTFARWLRKEYDELMIAFAETGADRDGTDWDLFCEKRYEAYVKKQLKGEQA
jgi:hypothetical protein